MIKYTFFDKCIIAVDNDIIVNITNLTETKTYKRIGSGRNTYICGQKLPYPYFNNMMYNSIEILKKANNLYDYSNEITGVYTSYYSNGNIFIEYFQINNKKNGIYKVYHRDGKLKEEWNYVDDILHGQSIIYNDKENKISEFMYNNGKKCGIYKKWFSGEYCSNKTYEEYMYDNDIKHGPFKLIFSNGDVTIGSYINNDINEFTTTTLDNIIIEKRTYDSEQNIYIYEKYYNSGIINEKYMINHKKQYVGKSVKYYENGNIKTICNYKDNNFIEKFISYYENGNIEFEENYDDTDKKTNHIIYYKSGNIKEKWSKINKLIYYESGNIKEKYTYINEFTIIEKYNEDGLLINYSYNLKNPS